MKTAVTYPSSNSDVDKRKFMDLYEKALEPFTKGRGIDWEIQIEECDVSTPKLEAKRFQTKPIFSYSALSGT